MDRPQAAGKPVDPATRLSELLSQSLEELTRPFDPPRPGPHPSRPVVPRDEAPAPAAAPPAPTASVRAPAPEPAPPAPEPSPEQARIDADKALAELEAELFAAAKQVDSDASIPHAEEHDDDKPADEPAGEGTHKVDLSALEAELALHDGGAETTKHDGEGAIAPLAPGETPLVAPASEADASGVIAKVRRLMLISMAVTVIAVGSVFGFIGYRIFKGEGSVEKRADKLPAPPAIPNEVTLSIPRGAKVIQSAVTNDRLVMTLEIDGKVEVRTFDVKTLAPTGRLNFSATP